jgi:predicted nucleic acid-binding protein
VSERVFLDTNILLYADDQDAGDKQRQAQDLLAPLMASGHAVVSTQVLQEFFAVATRKLRLAPEWARERVENLARLDVVLLRPELILSAIDLHRLRSISFWDALVIRAAAVAGCTRLLSEDLQHGQRIDGVRIENPFLPATPTPIP